ncbi:MAG TPA: hypothetical protein VIH92_09775 [Solirubrobacteraceae bacterium]
MAAKQQEKIQGARAIDWSSAELSDRALVVQLRGAGAKGWSKDFGGVLALLEQSGRGWGKVALKGSKVRVADVQAGTEEELRHFLESVVLQVNSDLGLEIETGAEDAGSEETQSGDRRLEAAERRMAATFRGFADEVSEEPRPSS